MDVTSSGNVVAFIDCEYNGFTDIFADKYESYCRWYRLEFGRDALLIDTMPGSGETWDKLQETWRAKRVATGGYKTFGGAGQVIWVKNGEVVDAKFLAETSFDKLKQRTMDAFSPKKIATRCSRICDK